MSKYDGLGSFLRAQSLSDVPMTFAEIERVTGAKLPSKAQYHRAWWSNNPSNNVMTKVWLAAGYRTHQVDIEGRRLVFRRVVPSTGKSAKAPSKRSDMNSADRAQEGHPMIGALKGTFTIAPDTDLTQPAFSPDEWDSIIADKLEKFDRTFLK